MFHHVDEDLVPNVCRVTNNPREIMVDLNRCYVMPTPTKKKDAVAKWAHPWTPSKSIKTIFLALKELCVRVVVTDAPYTPEPLLGRALDNIKQTNHGLKGVQQRR